MAELLLKYLSESKNLSEYSSDELKSIPLEFYQKYVDCLTLLSIWGKLPGEYRQNFDLQIKLPCFIHYNRPDWRTHVDGFPSPQGRCRFCLIGITNGHGNKE